MKILFFVFSLLSILYWLKKDFNAYFFFFSFFSRNVYNQLSRERTSSGIKIVSVGRIVPLRESCERTPEKNRVDVRLRASVNDVIRIDRLLSCGQMEIWHNRSPLSYCPVEGFFFVDLHICILKTNFTAENQLVCMGCPPTRKREQKKKIKFLLSRVSASTYERMFAYGNV